MKPLNIFFLAVGLIVLIGATVIVPRVKYHIMQDTLESVSPRTSHGTYGVTETATAEDLIRLSREGRDGMTIALGNLLSEKEAAFQHADQLKNDLIEGRPPSIKISDLVKELSALKDKLGDSRQTANDAFGKYEASMTRLLLDAAKPVSASKPLDFIALVGLLFSGIGVWLEWKKQAGEREKLKLEIQDLERKLGLTR